MSYSFALIGYPIQHSLSPWIHEQFLKRAELHGSYTLKEIAWDEHFAKRISELKSQSIDGFNVTVPYKQKIIPYLDELNEEAERIGAVNTVVHRHGRWVGYNTDGKGYVRSLHEQHPFLFADKNIKIAIIGAGGAARGIYDALVTEGFRSIDIANRTRSSADVIAALQQEQTTTNVLSLAAFEQATSKYDLIIQTTSVGMKPAQEKSILSSEVSFKKDSVLSDIVYQPIETTFLKRAKKRGTFIHHGHTMLLYQAQYAFELWTGLRVPLGNMEKQLSQILEGR